MVSGIKIGTGIYLTKSIYGPSNLLKNSDSDINNATGKATTIESRNAIITRVTVAKISTTKLPAKSEIAEAITFTGDGKNNKLIKLVNSVMIYHVSSKNKTEIITGQYLLFILINLCCTLFELIDNFICKFIFRF